MIIEGFSIGLSTHTHQTEKRYMSTENVYTVKHPSFQWRRQWFFYYEYAPHELYSMVWFGAFPFTRMVHIRSVKSTQFLTFSSPRLDECILSKLVKDRKLSRDNYGMLGRSQKMENGAVPSIISSGQKTTTMTASQVSEPLFHANSLILQLSYLKLLRKPFWIQNHTKIALNSTFLDLKWTQNGLIAFWTDSG